MKIENSEHKTKNSNSGFTFVEILIYMALMAIFITGAIRFSWDIIYSRVKSNVEEEVSQNLRFAGGRIAYEIRNASGINNITPSSISLSNTDSSRNPTVIDVSGGRLRITYGTNSYFLTSNRVTVPQLIFTNLSGSGATNVSFSIRVDSVESRSEWARSRTYSTSVELRLK